MNTSSGYHATIGKKKNKPKSGKPSPATKHGQQEVTPTFLSAYGKRRKAKVKGGMRGI